MYFERDKYPLFTKTFVFTNAANIPGDHKRCSECSGAGDTACTACVDGSYVTGAGKCEACQTPCTKCETSPTTCTGCTSGEFLDGTTCTACASSCTECTAANVCTSCKAAHFLDGDACTACTSPCTECVDTGENCGCPDGQFVSSGEIGRASCRERVSSPV